MKNKIIIAVIIIQFIFNIFFYVVCYSLNRHIEYLEMKTYELEYAMDKLNNLLLGEGGLR